MDKQMALQARERRKQVRRSLNAVLAEASKLMGQPSIIEPLKDNPASQIHGSRQMTLGRLRRALVGLA